MCRLGQLIFHFVINYSFIVICCCNDHGVRFYVHKMSIGECHTLGTNQEERLSAEGKETSPNFVSCLLAPISVSYQLTRYKRRNLKW